MAASGLPGGRMPAPAQDASRPKSDCSSTLTETPWRDSSQAIDIPITPPPTTTTSVMLPSLCIEPIAARLVG